MGSPCTATVPTWFTDSPTTCPIPCWYPALKPTTGAANQGTCASSAKDGYGGAIVNWNADASLAMVATGSLPWGVYIGQAVVIGKGIEVPGTLTTVDTIAGWTGKSTWWFPAFYADPIDNDESAFAISRNNGETWNQLSLIDTTIDWLNDVAISPDCTTIYLASVNRNTGLGCTEFDSVWRTSLIPM